MHRLPSVIVNALVSGFLALCVALPPAGAEQLESANFSVQTTFDELGRVSQTSDANGTSTFAYDDLNRLTSATPAVGQGVTYAYIADTFKDRWQTSVTLNGVGTWTFGEDPKGRLAQIYNPLAQLTTRYYDPDGKLVQETRKNGTVTNYGYNSRDFLTGIEHLLADGTNLDTFTYSYTDAFNGITDGTGRIRQETDSGNRVHK